MQLSKKSIVVGANSRVGASITVTGLNIVTIRTTKKQNDGESIQECFDRAVKDGHVNVTIEDGKNKDGIPTQTVKYDVQKFKAGADLLLPKSDSNENGLGLSKTYGFSVIENHAGDDQLLLIRTTKEDPNCKLFSGTGNTVKHEKLLVRIPAEYGTKLNIVEADYGTEDAQAFIAATAEENDATEEEVIDWLSGKGNNEDGTPNFVRLYQIVKA